MSDKTLIFQCARCKQIFRFEEDNEIEAQVIASKEFPQDFTSMSNYGGLHRVCINCYNQVKNQGKNSLAHEKLKKNIRIIWNKLIGR